MKKSKLLAIGLVALATTALSKEVLAQDTNAKLSLVPSTGEHEVVEPIDDKENDKTGQTGSFTLDIIPQFNFGSEELSSAGNALKLDGTVSRAAQVTDGRGGSQGWELSLGMSEFSNDDKTAVGDASKLKGVSLDTQIVDAVTTADSLSGAPTYNAVKILPNETRIVMSAAKGSGKGMGSWLAYFSKGSGAANKTTLSIPQGNYTGSYTATLTWTLSTTP
ncbi:WxL domain-containing protein [Carnobacterium maltaromaticum]|uniref:WxL domain-containing protein n=1 Tax=Carnobacterium maltaromaticum TaxID=2751 RepID=A0AAW9JX95_CARML|nr:WxL domain-containing protein [Carnobacterium maltaromaticum]MDZ5759244.1 WxL domain-containing protein [Carnobacterium maltaromaticum]